MIEHNFSKQLLYSKSGLQSIYSVRNVACLTLTHNRTFYHNFSNKEYILSKFSTDLPWFAWNITILGEVCKATTTRIHMVLNYAFHTSKCSGYYAQFHWQNCSSVSTLFVMSSLQIWFYVMITYKVHIPHNSM